MRNESVQTFAGVLLVVGSGAGKGAETSALGIGCVVEEIPDVIEGLSGTCRVSWVVEVIEARDIAAELIVWLRVIFGAISLYG